MSGRDVVGPPPESHPRLALFLSLDVLPPTSVTSSHYCTKIGNGNVAGSDPTRGELDSFLWGGRI